MSTSKPETAETKASRPQPQAAGQSEAHKAKIAAALERVAAEEAGVLERLHEA
jgi:hypothetical protein